MSDWGADAVQRQIERDGLAELVAANEEIHGPLTSEEIDAARAELGDARRRAAGAHRAPSRPVAEPVVDAVAEPVVEEVSCPLAVTRMLAP
ncbi:hypothetical protein [Streptomyces sp. NPDC058579]|uniref:hypothetical protein n=1 Tax=Streptomyces sp. NPDC058579 TaxID=3346548 RepID=UPI0036575885